MAKNFWEKLKKPVMVVAPMSGVADEPFRLMFLKYGKPDVFWTEFISASALNSKKGRAYCLKVLKHAPKERPIIAQIFGSDPAQIEIACKEIKEMGFDGIDINMGCPDKDIEKQGAGSDLIKNPELAKEVIRAAKKSGLPVSVKTRIGYEKNEIEEWIPVLLKEEISALAVHFRTRNELYLPPAHWELAEKIIELRNKYAPKTLVIGNGDVKTIEQANKLIKETGVDGVMFGRGVMGNPWFFSKKMPTISERLNAIVEHAEIFESLFDKNFDIIKKHFHAYAKGFNGAHDLREKLMKVKSAKETKKVVEDFLASNVV